MQGVPDTSVAYTVSILKGGRPDYGGVFQTAIAAYEKECLAMVCSCIFIILLSCCSEGPLIALPGSTIAHRLVVLEYRFA